MDWEVIKEFAYGPLNLNPEQLGRLTHGEFLDLMKGYKWRQRRKLEEYAQLASWVTAPHLKRPIDPKKLLKSDKEKEKTNPDKTKAEILYLKERLGVR